MPITLPLIGLALALGVGSLAGSAYWSRRRSRKALHPLAQGFPGIDLGLSFHAADGMAILVSERRRQVHVTGNPELVVSFPYSAIKAASLVLDGGKRRWPIASPEVNNTALQGSLALEFSLALPAGPRTLSIPVASGPDVWRKAGPRGVGWACWAPAWSALGCRYQTSRPPAIGARPWRASPGCSPPTRSSTICRANAGVELCVAGGKEILRARPQPVLFFATFWL